MRRTGPTRPITATRHGGRPPRRSPGTGSAPSTSTRPTSCRGSCGSARPCAGRTRDPPRHHGDPGRRDRRGRVPGPAHRRGHPRPTEGGVNVPPTKTAPTKTAPATAPPAPRLEVLPVGQIRTGPNVRTALGDLKELAASIKALGVIEPLIVEPNGKGYRVIAGHRRLAAAKVAGLRQVPAIVRTVEDAERIELQLIENLQRADLSPTEEASAFERLITEHGYTHRKLGERIGRSQGHISKRLSLLTLPATEQAAVDSGRISIEGGLELTKLAGEPARVAAVLKHDPREIPRQVERQLAAIETGARVAALHEQIAKEGLRTIALVPDRYGGRPVLPKGAMPLGNDWRELHIDPGKHSKLDCHAVYVEMSAWGKPKIRAVCTDAAKQHPAEGKKS